MKKENEKIKCACGCGTIIPSYDKWGRRRHYCSGHGRKGRKDLDKKLSKMYLGKNNPFWGHKHSEEFKKKQVVNNSKTSVERLGEEKAKGVSQKLSKKLKGRISPNKGKTYEELYGKERAKELKKLRNEIFSRVKHKEWTDEQRKTRSILMKQKWQEQEYREKTLEKMLKNRYKKPTSFEKKISELCFKHSLPFFYTGNGSFFVGKKNPDFKHKTLPIVIEVFSNFFKKSVFGSIEVYMKNRELYFAQHGFKIIFITEDEVMDKEWEKICLVKINSGLENE